MDAASELDQLIQDALKALAQDHHVAQWKAKETNWVSYFAFKYLVPRCRPGTTLSHTAQIGVEVPVPQLSKFGRRAVPFDRRTVRKDIVIWSIPGGTCWDDKWSASIHPLAILEWKVHRPPRKNPLVSQEREWLREYCMMNTSVLAYAIEVDGIRCPRAITCARFLGEAEDEKWFEIECGNPL